MLRTLLIATVLLTASGTALARDGHGYGHVVSVEPHFNISFGTRHHDGFRVEYESGGDRYWTYTPYRPSHTIVLPPRHMVHHVYYTEDYGHGYGHGKDKWHKRNKHDRDWDDDRRGHGHRDRHHRDRD